MISAGKFWIGIGFSVAFLALFFLTVDVNEMANSLAGANYIFLAPAIIAYLVSVLFRTLRWRVLLRHMKPVSTRRLYPVVTIGYMANAILPMRLGEIVRSYYIGEREGISKTSALATIFIERVLDALTLLFFMAAIALFVPLSGLAQAFGDRSGLAWPFLVAVFSAPFLVAFVTLLLFAAYPDQTKAVSRAFVRPLPQRFETPIRDMIEYLLRGLIPLRNPRTITHLFLLSIPIWLLEALLFFFIALSFDLHLAFPGIGQMAVGMVLVTAIANIGSSIPAAPGGIGLFELITRETLVLLPLASVDRSVAAGFATLTHAALIFPMILLGQVFLWTGHISLRKLTKAGKANAELANSSAQTPSGSADGAGRTTTQVAEDGRAR